jgi:arginine decarboxylase
MSESWNINIAKHVYGIENYVRREVIDIDREGYLVIKVGGRNIRVKELMDQYRLDVAYIRVLPSIKASMDLVYSSYQIVSSALSYSGGIKPVFPMKVNPTPVVIEAIFEYGERYRWGFNVGSLGELKVIEKFAESYSPRTLVFDGFVTEHVAEELKKLVRLGWRVIVDVESEQDLELLSKHPEFEIGIRVKPIVKLHGKWSSSVGLGSKFGMTTNTLIKLASEFKFIKERARLLHMHPGSQLYKLEDLKNYFEEVKEVYRLLKRLDFENVDHVDPGGGLAYPYVDARDGSEESPDYTVVDYFRELLTRLREISPHPTVVYEGGRFIVASHRLVVAKVVDVRSYSAVHTFQERFAGPRELETINDVKRFLDIVDRFINEIREEALHDNGRRELYEDLIAILREDLPHKLTELIKSGKTSIESVISDPRLRRILTRPSKRFVLNMSIFADIPDTVLVGQYFQPVPAYRLNEPPHVLASISDLTCDSMGEIKEFISNGRNAPINGPLFTTLDDRLLLLPNTKLRLGGVPLHLPSKGENYYVVFLDTGAYQDTLAMKHNLIYGAPELIIRERDGEVEIKLVEHEGLYT